MTRSATALGIGILAIGMSTVAAEEFIGTISKVEQNKITIVRGTGKKKKELTLTADEKCRVVVARYDIKAKRIEAGDEIAGGLKNALFSNLEKEPVEAWIRTTPENEKVLELRLFQSTKKKKK